MNTPVKKGIYEHYKGKRYEVLTTARHHETCEEFVVYKALYKTDFGEESLWIRPLAMFRENVIVNGREVPRFRFTEALA